MAWLTSYATSYAQVDGVDTCTVTDFVSGEITANGRCKKVGMTSDERRSSLFTVQADDQAFILWSLNLGGAEPEIGWSITIGSDIWNIKAVSRTGDPDQWRVIGTKE